LGHLVIVGDIHLDAHRIPAGIDGGRRLLGLLLIQVGDDHGAPLGHQAPGDGQADPPGSPGDHSYPLLRPLPTPRFGKGPRCLWFHLARQRLLLRIPPFAPGVPGSCPLPGAATPSWKCSLRVTLGGKDAAATKPITRSGTASRKTRHHAPGGGSADGALRPGRWAGKQGGTTAVGTCPGAGSPGDRPAERRGSGPGRGAGVSPLGCPQPPGGRCLPAGPGYGPPQGDGAPPAPDPPPRGG